MNDKLISREFVESQLREFGVPGMGIGVVRDGKVLMSEGFGYRDREKQLPVTPQTLFGIASCSKAFTSALIAMLVDEGKLTYDQPIVEYLPDFKLYDDYATAHCTVRDMLSHMTGIAGHDALWVDQIDRAELFRRLRYIEPNKSFRETVQYSNTIFTIIGYIAERLTGESWDELIKTRIFQPLGMTRSNTSVDEFAGIDDVAVPYWNFHGDVRRIRNWNVDLGAPCAGVNTCVEDMCKWLQLHLNCGSWEGRQLISEENMMQMHTAHVAYPIRQWNFTEVPNVGGYGMGWVTDSYRGEETVFHNGEIEGYCAQQLLMPKRNIGVVLLMNRHGSCGILENRIMFAILDSLLDLPPIDWVNRLAPYASDKYEWDVNLLPGEAVKGTKPAHSAEEYAGKYWNPGYGSFDILKKGDGIEGLYRGVVQAMTHYHYETFRVPDIKMDTLLVTTPLTFVTDPATGKVSGFDIIMEPTIKPIRFEKE